MCDKQRLRPACAYVQSDQSYCWSLEYFTSIKLLTEHSLEFLSLKGGCTGLSGSSLHLSKCHIVGNHMSRLICKRDKQLKINNRADWLCTYIQLDSISNGRFQRIHTFGSIWNPFCSESSRYFTKFEVIITVLGWKRKLIQLLIFMTHLIIKLACIITRSCYDSQILWNFTKGV